MVDAARLVCALDSFGHRGLIGAKHDAAIVGDDDSAGGGALRRIGAAMEARRLEVDSDFSIEANSGAKAENRGRPLEESTCRNECHMSA